MGNIFKDHPFAAVSAAVGVLITVGTRVNDLYTIFNLGLSSQVWELIGLLIFFVAMGALVHAWHKKSSAQPTSIRMETSRSSPSIKDSAPPPPSPQDIQTSGHFTAGGNIIIGSVVSTSPGGGSTPADFPRGSQAARISFKAEDLRLWDLIAGSAIIRNKKFEECVFYGPAVMTVLGTGTKFIRCGWAAPDIDSMFIVVPEGSSAAGIYAILNCEFLNCKFVNIAIVGTEEVTRRFKAGIQGHDQE